MQQSAKVERGQSYSYAHQMFWAPFVVVEMADEPYANYKRSDLTQPMLKEAINLLYTLSNFTQNPE